MVSKATGNLNKLITHHGMCTFVLTNVDHKSIGCETFSYETNGICGFRNAIYDVIYHSHVVIYGVYIIDITHCTMIHAANPQASCKVEDIS